MFRVDSFFPPSIPVFSQSNEQHPRFTFIYGYKSRWRLDARVNSNPDVAYSIAVAGVRANKVRKGLRAVGRRNVRNTTVDKGKGQILYISPPSKTNGALNGGFRHGKRNRTEWKIQDGTTMEAGIALEYWPVRLSSPSTLMYLRA